MRDYSKVSPQFWTGETGRALRAHSPEALIVAMYLMTCPSANMIGLYYVPILYIGHETGLGIEGARKGLRGASEAGFCTYDEASEHVFVHAMVRFQVGDQLSPKDNRCKGVENELERVPKGALRRRFLEMYASAFHLNFDPDEEAPCKPLASQEQEQEQEQEQKKNSCAAPPSPAPAESDSPSKPNPEKPSSPVFIAIPLNSGEEYPITESDVAEFRDLYPAVDVPQALRNIRGWALANPTKRKTRAGVRRFVNAWLAKDQDKGQQVVQLHPPARTFREVSL